jgi:hypothetical protein
MASFSTHAFCIVNNVNNVGSGGVAICARDAAADMVGISHSLQHAIA